MERFHVNAPAKQLKQNNVLRKSLKIKENHLISNIQMKKSLNRKIKKIKLINLK